MTPTSRRFRSIRLSIGLSFVPSIPWRRGDLNPPASRVMSPVLYLAELLRVVPPEGEGEGGGGSPLPHGDRSWRVPRYQPP